MLRSASTPVPSPTLRRSFVSLVTGLALVLVCGGLVVPHSPSEAHADLPVGTRLDSNAIHPDAPLHMETARPETVQACPACLLQQGSLSVQSGSATLSLPDVSPDLITPGPRSPEASPAPRLGPARAPPAVLSLV